MCTKSNQDTASCSSPHDLSAHPISSPGPLPLTTSPLTSQGHTHDGQPVPVLCVHVVHLHGQALVLQLVDHIAELLGGRLLPVAGAVAARPGRGEAFRLQAGIGGVPSVHAAGAAVAELAPLGGVALLLQLGLVLLSQHIGRGADKEAVALARGGPACSRCCGCQGQCCALDTEGLLEAGLREPRRLRVAGPPAAALRVPQLHRHSLGPGEKPCQKLGNEADAFANSGAARCRG